MKQVVKAILPQPVIEQAVEFRDWLHFVTFPKRDFDPARLHPLDTLSPDTIYQDKEIEAAWNIDHKEIAEAYGHDDCFGGVNPGDRRALYYFIMATKPKKVLEVGTHIGASTLYIACALKRLGQGGHLITADIVDVNDPAGGAWKSLNLKTSPKGFAEELGCADNISFHVGPCLDYMQQTDEKFDFIFLDGDHKARAVYQEMSAALPLLNDNGVILLHDFYPGAKALYPDDSIISGPFRALKRINRENPSIEVVPLGNLPWPTKQGTTVTSLALVLSRK